MVHTHDADPHNPKNYAPIVGVWEVNAKDAPFPWHMFTFTPFGTMMQTNPPAGNQDESDSNGHGVWRGKYLEDGRYVVAGKFVEMKADLTAGKFIGKGEIHFSMVVSGDTFSGDGYLIRFDADGQKSGGPFPTPVSGTRLVADEALPEVA
jgi:hypothetical protein